MKETETPWSMRTYIPDAKWLLGIRSLLCVNPERMHQHQRSKHSPACTRGKQECTVQKAWMDWALGLRAQCFH